MYGSTPPPPSQRLDAHHLPAPRFIVNDPLCTIHVNGWCAYSGSFVSGLDVRFPVVPVPLTVKTRSRRVGLAPAPSGRVIWTSAGGG